MTPRYSVLMASLVVALALVACNERRDDGDATAAADVPAVDPTTTTPPDTAAGSDAMPATDQPSDATADASTATAAPSERAALGVLNAINDHEIAAGKQALAKGVQGEIATYAQMMIDQHGENRTRTSALGADAAGADARAQQQKGEAELAKLDALSGDAYAKAYVDAMVKGHTEALAALDGALIPAATTQAVRDHLASTRGHVAEHLERAKALAGQAR